MQYMEEKLKNEIRIYHRNANKKKKLMTERKVTGI